MSERRTIRTWQNALKRYDVEYGCTLPEFLKLIDNVVKSIPAKERANVVVEWTDGDDCDSGYIEFTHYRSETDKELANRDRAQDEANRIDAQYREQQERQILAALKNKYEA